MELTLKKDKRNLQPLYDDILKSYSNGSIEDMKVIAREFLNELRTTKVNLYNFTQTINKTFNKDKLLMFITNLHMQDSQETASIK